MPMLQMTAGWSPLPPTRLAESMSLARSFANQLHGGPRILHAENNQHHNTMTTTQIKIAAEPTDLVKYTHCQSRSAANHLAAAIEELESQGFAVLDAVSSRSAVPNTYKSAYKMSAPFYRFRAETRTIELVNGRLENRPRGSTIPAKFEIAGDKTPKGFRCFNRLESSIIIRRA